jgi:hydrogenase maturation factor
MACSVSPDGDQTCITCSDEALSARVMQVDQETGFALVAIGGHTEEVDISLVDAVAPGDSLLVHGGVAIARLDER